MLLRVRVWLADRPGSLGTVAQTLGAAGADIVQVTVLERLAGRAVDDFTVSWPTGAPPGRLRAGLDAAPGVQVIGLWRAVGTPAAGSDAQLLGQIAANPGDGLATLVDAAPGLLAADWAAALTISGTGTTSGGPETTPAGTGTTPAGTGTTPAGGKPGVVHASWQAPDPLTPPELRPLRLRALTDTGVHYAAVPFDRASLVLVVARTETGTDGPPEPERPDDAYPLMAPAFHAMELDRIAQLVRAAAVILGDRLTASVHSGQFSAPRSASG